MLFQNGSVFYQKKFHALDVRTEAGIITEVKKGLEPFKKEEVVDLHGKRLLPGLIDVHTHGRMGEDFTDASQDGIRKAAGDYAKQGVTSLLATTMTMEESYTRKMLGRLRQAIESPGKGSRILGINLEGPFLGKEKKGCHDERHLKPIDRELFLEWEELAGGTIKMLDLDPCYPQALSFIKEFSKKIIISLAHTCASYDLACQAADDGAFHVTHLFNAMNSLHHREPGLLGMIYDREVYAELITDGLHIHPSVIRMMFAMIPDKICLVSDSLRAAGQPDGSYELGGLCVTVKDGKATLADGTLACSTISVFEGMKRCMKFGVPEEQAILAATYQPACSIHMEDKIGSILSGLFADFVITDMEYTLEEVYVGGEKIENGTSAGNET